MSEKVIVYNIVVVFQEKKKKKKKYTKIIHPYVSKTQVKGASE